LLAYKPENDDVQYTYDVIGEWLGTKPHDTSVVLDNIVDLDIVSGSAP
jgi:hypothetical protein